MSLHQDKDKSTFYDYNYNEQEKEYRKNVRKVLEDRLELQRLKKECFDEFDEYNSEFDWSYFDKN